MTKTPPRLAALTPYLLSKTGKAVRGRVASRLALRGVRMWHMAILDAPPTPARAHSGTSPSHWRSTPAT
ncbi:hypothetical protein ACI2LC_11880 [Nonomuraea wenchangensis]|uniref:hypothetical protein n=1 Tax=Nonomuraea wenchangensis TaxID=568860 RepID=UPI0037B34E3B